MSPHSIHLSSSGPTQRDFFPPGGVRATCWCQASAWDPGGSLPPPCLLHAHPKEETLATEISGRELHGGDCPEVSFCQPQHHPSRDPFQTPRVWLLTSCSVTLSISVPLFITFLAFLRAEGSRLSSEQLEDNTQALSGDSVTFSCVPGISQGRV